MFLLLLNRKVFLKNCDGFSPWGVYDLIKCVKGRTFDDRVWSFPNNS